MKELIRTLLGDIVRKITLDFKGGILIEVPENKERGDYTANIAFALTKILQKSSQEIAEYLVNELKKQKIKDFSKIEAKKGFINFFLSEDCLKRQLEEILKKKNKYGNSDIGESHKIQIEFISANPTGPLTIGNGRGGFYGDTLANILESQGYKVIREYYINDRGEQVLLLGRSIKVTQGRVRRIDSPNRFAEPGNLYKGNYINELAKQIDEDLNAEEAGQKAIELVLKTYIKPILKKLNIKFNVWFSEKTLYQKGDYEKVLSELMKSDWVYEKDGATWMKTSRLGDSEDRVLIKKDGSKTYFLSDILYHFDKFKIRKFDKVIDIWGADHHGYAPRLKAATSVLGVPEDNLEIIITQLARLVKNGKEVKISKRAGMFITLEELVGEVGLDAARFFFLMYSPNTHMDFDMALAKQRSQKNPVYYAQYAHARIASILAKIKNQKSPPEADQPRAEKIKIINQNLKLLNNKAELDLIRKLIEFPEILNDIAANYEVHRLPRYSLELAREFHNFYEKCRVITEDKNLTSARLGLAMATKIVLANALNLMGIKAPDKM